MCDAETEFVAGQPLKLLPEMQVNFDEVLAPGDLLYVPPGLAHYGVAEDDCLTFSFGFRMPNISEMMDRVSDKFSADEMLRTPLQDIVREKSTANWRNDCDRTGLSKSRIVGAFTKLIGVG